MMTEMHRFNDKKSFSLQLSCYQIAAADSLKKLEVVKYILHEKEEVIKNLHIKSPG